ncbi:MAG: TetR/AcrR family transcriptional regulator, partial [Chloroflexota bacterium]
FYGRGIQAVGMDEIRSASGISLKRLYQLYPTKSRLVEAYLDRRDDRWRARLAQFVARRRSDPEERILAVFDWLEAWFAEPGFRGCAWINSFGELGAGSPAIAARARGHKEAFSRYLRNLVAAAGLADDLADHVLLLAEGAMVNAAIFGNPAPASQARTAAKRLLAAAKRGG